MSEAIKQLSKAAEADENVFKFLQGLNHDAINFAGIPARLKGAAQRALLDVGEGAFRAVEMATGLADEHQPQLRFGDDGKPLKILDAVMGPYNAGDVSSVAGDAARGLGWASRQYTPEEIRNMTALQAIESRINASDERASARIRSGAGRGNGDSGWVSRSDILADAAAGQREVDGSAAAATLGELGLGAVPADGPRVNDRGMTAQEQLDELAAADRPRVNARGMTAQEQLDELEASDIGDILARDRKRKQRKQRKPRVAQTRADAPEEPEADYSQQAIDLFKNTHGTSFDPKSSMDKGKLEKMKKLLAKNKGKEMTPNQFALQFYREYP